MMSTQVDENDNCNVVLTHPYHKHRTVVKVEESIGKEAI